MFIKPTKETLDSAYIKDYDALYKQAQQDTQQFWGDIAGELSWFKKWGKVLDWQYPYARWFAGGQCNIVANALDRHLLYGRVRMER